MKILKTLLVAAFATVAFSACSSEKAANSDSNTEEAAVVADPATPAPAADAADAVINLDDDEAIRPNTKVNELTVLDFNAVWCGPCKKLTPSFHKAASAFAGKAKFYAVDVDNNPQTAQAFGVQSIPMVVIIKPNGQIQTLVGLDPYLEGLSSYETASKEELDAVIYDNLTKIINNALK